MLVASEQDLALQRSLLYLEDLGAKADDEEVRGQVVHAEVEGRNVVEEHHRAAVEHHKAVVEHHRAAVEHHMVAVEHHKAGEHDIAEEHRMAEVHNGARERRKDEEHRRVREHRRDGEHKVGVHTLEERHTVGERHKVKEHRMDGERKRQAEDSTWAEGSKPDGVHNQEAVLRKLAEHGLEEPRQMAATGHQLFDQASN